LQQAGEKFAVGLLVDQRAPKSLLAVDVPQQRPETELRPSLAGHRIALGVVQQRNGELLEQPVLEILRQHRLAVDIHLALATGLAPAALDLETILANTQRNRSALIFLSQPGLVRTFIRIGARIAEKEVKRLQPFGLAGVGPSNQQADPGLEIEGLGRSDDQPALQPRDREEGVGHFTIALPISRRPTSWSNRR